jgi:hypothetical protein
MSGSSHKFFNGSINLHMAPLPRQISRPPQQVENEHEKLTASGWLAFVFSLPNTQTVASSGGVLHSLVAITAYSSICTSHAFSNS